MINGLVGDSQMMGGDRVGGDFRCGPANACHAVPFRPRICRSLRNLAWHRRYVAESLVDRQARNGLSGVWDASLLRLK